MNILLFLCALLILVIGYEAYCIHRAFALARPIIASAVPYTQEGDGSRVLFAGESTGVGTGARDPQDSVAGRFGADAPDATIENISKNGARMSDLLSALQALPQGKKFDIIVLQIGGNDILNFTSVSVVQENLKKVLAEAKLRGNRVYLMTTGDVGNAPAFGPVLSHLYSVRTKELTPLFVEETTYAGVGYVDLFEAKETDPFALEPLKYHAGDGVHPSSEGYGIWYGKLKGAMK